MKITRSVLSVVALAAGASLATSAHASLIFTIQPVGSDVVATLSGSLNTSGMGIFNPGTAVLGATINSSQGILSIGGGLADVWGGISGPGSFTSGGFAPDIFASGSGSGDAVALIGNFTAIILPDGYVSGAPLSGTATFSNQSLATLFLDVGTYTYTTPNDTVIVNVVPTPSAAALFGLSGLVALRRRRCQS